MMAHITFTVPESGDRVQDWLPGSVTITRGR